MATPFRATRLRRALPFLLAAGVGIAVLACGGSSTTPEDPPDPVVKVHEFTYNTDTGFYKVVSTADGTTTEVTQDDVDRDLVGSLCGKCHAEQVDHVKDSVHFKLAAGTDRIMFPGGGAHGMLDRACGLPSTTGLTNSISNVGLGECAKCHVGRYLPVMEGAFASMFGQMGLPDPQQQATTLINAGIDCLVCHAETYKAHPTDGRILADMAASATLDAASPTMLGSARDSRDNADFNGDGAPDFVLYSTPGGELDTPLMMDSDGDGTPDTPWPTVAQDRSRGALASITVTNEHNCLRCHEHARTGYKRGTLFIEGHDVHSTASTGPFLNNENQCVVCHVLPDDDHKFVRGHMVGGDLGAADFPPPPPGVAPDPTDPSDLTCTTCHDATTLPQPIHSARHLETVSCQACHIPWGSGITYSLFGHGGHVAFGRTEDGRDTKLIAADMMVAGDKADLDNDFEAFKTRPIYTWFDGGTSFLAQSLAVKGMPNARIVPFKPMANGMVFDARFFDNVMALNEGTMPDGTTPYQYNAHSMYRFFYNNDGANGDNAQAFANLKMLDMTRDDVAKTTVFEFWNDMATPDSLTMAMMQIFPNLVYFNKADFGYEHFMAPTGSPYDLTGMDGTGGPDGIIDSGTNFHFDMLHAANAGLMQFMGFNGPMMFSPTYSWYPQYTNVNQTISMKLPDGSLMKMFLGMQAQKILDPDERNAFMDAIANYPAFSQVTLGGHGVLPKGQALGSSCADCHSATGVMAHKVPVTKKEVVDMGPMGMFEFPVYQWKYYKLHDLIDRGLAASSEDVANKIVDMDIHGDATVLRISSTEYTLNWFAAYAGMPSAYRPADHVTALAGTSLKASDLTWNGGLWMPVLEPVTFLTSNLEVLGYPSSGIPMAPAPKPETPAAK